MAKQFYPIDADLIERIKSVMQEGGVRTPAFAESLSYSRGNLSSILNGKRPCPNSLLESIARVYNIRYNWLLTGEGTMHEEEKPMDADTMSLPLIPLDAMAGALVGSSDMIMDYDCEQYIVPIFKGANFLIRVQGDSMTPRYLSGDIVACKRVEMDNLWFQWGKTYVLDTRQGALLKRIEPADKEGFVQICSDNTKYKPFTLPIDEINGVALVVGTIRVD
jgi:phage repressor protein C with HTH and peptisase S24 domain